MFDRQSGLTVRIMREVNQHPKLNIVWSWENDWNEVEPYHPEVSNQIESYYQKRDLNYSQIVIGNQEFWIDLKNQFQISVRSMKKRRIERYTIPDEKFIWQWQNQSGRFINYPETVSSVIENTFFLRPDNPVQVFIHGRSYFIDVRKMCEIDELEAKVRQIRRVPENYIKYKWSWKDEEEKWHVFSSYLTEKIEENYHNPEAAPILIIINYTQFEIDTKSMLERSVLSGKTYALKREPLSNDFAVWGWTDKTGTFKTFPISTSKLIEAHYLLNDPSPLQLNLREKKYQVLIRNKTKINLETRNYKRIERRYVSNNYPPNLDLLPKTECLKVFKFLTQIGCLPEDWNNSQSEEIEKFDASDAELIMLSEKFHKTMEPEDFILSNICRIQNVMLINSFLLERARLLNIHPSFEEPKLLFYVPNKNDDLTTFYNGIDSTLEGHYSPLDTFGKGYYFTENPKACHDYAWEKPDGKRVLICFWVLIGRVTHVSLDNNNLSTLYGDKYQKWNEVKKTSKVADCSKGLVNEEEMYIVYNAERCYPLYVVEYDQTN